MFSDSLHSSNVNQQYDDTGVASGVEMFSTPHSHYSLAREMAAECVYYHNKTGRVA